MFKDYNNNEMEDILTHQFYFVCNGCEISSGALRNGDLDLITKGFIKVGYSEDIIVEKFNNMYTSFKYAIRRHIRIVPGIDRILMLILNEINLREAQIHPLIQLNKIR